MDITFIHRNGFVFALTLKLKTPTSASNCAHPPDHSPTHPWTMSSLRPSSPCRSTEKKFSQMMDFWWFTIVEPKRHHLKNKSKWGTMLWRLFHSPWISKQNIELISSKFLREKNQEILSYWRPGLPQANNCLAGRWSDVMSNPPEKSLPKNLTRFFLVEWKLLV